MRPYLYFAAIFLLSLSCQPIEKKQERSVAQVMDDVITRLYETESVDQYDSINDAFMLKFLSEDEKKVLATRYLYFTVDVPVTVSLMHHKEQTVIPFWMKDAGFVKTADVVKNQEGYEYEVWEKKYKAGKVELGINGFDKHSPVYFITVAPQNVKDDLHITNVYPSEFVINTMKVGAFTYHDWSDLLLTEMPDRLIGQRLFTTVRGRAFY